ncbi:hypothetical protein BKA01_002839 [Pseudonocardia eucalypti]|nr:hypothetical protein [Pseudonocardia eucalypti]
MDVEDPAVASVIIRPHVLDDLRAAHCPAGIGQEVAQDPAFPRGQIQGTAIPPNLQRFIIDLDIGEPQHGVGTLPRVCRSAQQCPNLSEEIIEAEGFGQIPVSANGQPHGRAGGLVSVGKKQDRGVSGISSSQLTGKRGTILVKAGRIDDQQIRPQPFRAGQRLS